MTHQEAFLLRFNIVDNLERVKSLSYDESRALDLAFSCLIESIPRIMEFDEITQDMPHLLWCEETGNGLHGLYPAIAWEANRVNSADFIMFSENGFDGNCGARAMYGKTWRCWTHKPSQEQMSAERLADA